MSGKTHQNVSLWSVAKHYGCKRVKKCGLTANGRSQAYRVFFLCRKYELLLRSLRNHNLSWAGSKLERCCSWGHSVQTLSQNRYYVVPHSVTNLTGMAGRVWWGTGCSWGGKKQKGTAQYGSEWQTDQNKRINKATPSKRAREGRIKPFHSWDQKVHSPNLLKRKCISKVVRICIKIIFHLSKLWKAKFSLLCDVIFIVRLQGNFDIDHSQECKG